MKIIKEFKKTILIGLLIFIPLWIIILVYLLFITDLNITILDNNYFNIKNQLFGKLIILIIFSSFPLFIFKKYLKTRDVELNFENKIFNVKGPLKKNNINIKLSDIKKVTFIDKKNIISDYGEVFSEKIIIYNANNDIIFEYEAKKLSGYFKIIDYLIKENIEVIYKEKNK